MIKNVVLIMADQLRKDYLSCYGSELNTPNIDRLAEGAKFSCCTSSNPVCTPARCSLLTGKYSHQIGMLSMSGDLSPQHPTYLRALQKAGYTTYGVGKFHFNQGWPWETPSRQGHNLFEDKEKIKEYGFDHIWEASGKQLAERNYCDYCKYLDDNGILDAFRSYLASCGQNTNVAKDVNFTGDCFPFESRFYIDHVIYENAVKMLDAHHSNTPFFMLLSFCSPHAPFDPPAEYLDRVPYEERDNFVGDIDEDTKKKMYRLRRAYKAMVLLVDDLIGKFINDLKRKGLYEDTVILFTADHGEMMGDHGLAQKSSYYWQSENVPLIIWDGEKTCKTYDCPVELTDVTATILDFFDIDYVSTLTKPWPAFHDRLCCKSLLPLLKGEVDQIREFSFSECDGRWQMVRNDACKYVRMINNFGSEELFFDLKTDANETKNEIFNRKYETQIEKMREYRQNLMDYTPTAQLNWLKWGHGQGK